MCTHIGLDLSNRRPFGAPPPASWDREPQIEDRPRKLFFPASPTGPRPWVLSLEPHPDLTLVPHLLRSARSLCSKIPSVNLQNNPDAPGGASLLPASAGASGTSAGIHSMKWQTTLMACGRGRGGGGDTLLGRIHRIQLEHRLRRCVAGVSLGRGMSRAGNDHVGRCQGSGRARHLPRR